MFVLHDVIYTCSLGNAGYSSYVRESGAGDA
jgi:hypothetical protein